MEKLFTGVLILNWNDKGMRVVKRNNRKLSPYEIPIKVNIRIIIPEQREIVANGKIELPEYKVNEMLIESI